MFAVKFKGQTCKVFYVNNPKPVHPVLDNVLWFNADGDELQLIRAQFDNIPITKGNSCSWTGEMAEFVFRNLVCPLPWRE